ncbi:hypothetical protein, partial [Pseudomonas syringae]
LTGDEFDAMALTGQHFNFHRLLLGQHIGSSKPPVLPRGVNSRLALGGHFYSGGDTFSDGVSRQPGTLGYLMQRELVAEVHPPDFSQHFHADHPVFSCSKSEQKQLNTWVSFQSAEQPLLGQFSVSGNSLVP